MYCFKLFLVIFAVLSSTSSIYKGKAVKARKRYMVYLLQAEESATPYYPEWTCGGSIVHPWYILTAAACIYNVGHVYAIAGINTYMPLRMTYSNPCINDTRRKIVKHCAPKNYDFGNYGVDGKWFRMDIILGKVDRPYGVDNNREFIIFHCDYPPAVIEINYNKFFENQVLDVVALGYGHTQGYGLSWTNPPDSLASDLNSNQLNYMSGRLLSRFMCEAYLPSKNFKAYYPGYSMCFLNTGNINENGTFKEFSADVNYDQFYGTVDDGAICQNDHGSPLVAWRGGQEIVIGVASYSLVDKNMMCKGPSVFTSTACVGKFLYCKLTQDATRRARFCKDAHNFTEETDIPWNQTWEKTTTQMPPR